MVLQKTLFFPLKLSQRAYVFVYGLLTAWQ